MAPKSVREESKSKLEQLNRIHEVIYEESSREVAQVSALRTLSEEMATQHVNVFDFAVKRPTLFLAHRVRLAETPDEESEALPVEPEPPDRPNDGTTESSHGENGENFPGAAERPPSTEDVDPLEAEEERRRRVGRAQDEELRWANLRLVLKGGSSSLGYKGCPRGLQNGGPICAEWRRPLQMVSMDFVIPLPKSRRGNTALLLFLSAFTGFVMAKAVSDISALCVAQAFEECVCQSTLKAMASSLKRGFGRQSDALAWRREVNRQQEIALKMAKEYQAVEKARRASEHNDSLSRQAKRLYLDRGLTRTLKTAEWKESSQILPSGPCVSVEGSERVQKIRLARELTDEARLDFNEELLAEDSWGTDMLAGEYEVESILDDRRPMETSTRRSVREFLVKWVGYDEPTSESMTNLSCGGLLYENLCEKRSCQRFQMVEVAA
ncbi:unnamed protein product [Phytophthora fragariaefolia]|uniref:Unnamed protein product n=1 Tax=Phytophthora fragariaefolia TaxID=1490495 RepID=A0A9W6Y6I6_9STRA|nr:unnamed protein product [Phytophthora fragariaefolia]